MTIPWNKGKTGIYSEETKFKMGSGFRGISSPMKGRKHTEETRKRMSESSKGQIAWNKGKIGIYSKETLNKMSKAFKGKTYQQIHGKERTKEILIKKSKAIWKYGCKGYYQKKARKIMGNHLGRELRSEEHIHHLDHNIKNNFIGNLHLFPANSKHITYHQMKIRFVKEILAQT